LVKNVETSTKARHGDYPLCKYYFAAIGN